jgi:Predicted phosphoesterases, related to the Icc protein
MKFLVLSDMHGNIPVLDTLDAEFHAADAVLFAGDFAEFKRTETGSPALEALCKKHETIFAVIGNCDEPDFLKELEKKDISVENTLVYHEGLCFAGSGGGSKFTGTTPNERSDEELLADLDIVADTKDGTGADGWNNLICIMHNPPKDTKCDAVNPSLHAGSPLLRKFIEDQAPLAVVTGHIHEGAAVDTINNTVIINPGALADGRYAVLEVEKDAGSWKVTRAELKTAGRSPA